MPDINVDIDNVDEKYAKRTLGVLYEMLKTTEGEKELVRMLTRQGMEQIVAEKVVRDMGKHTVAELKNLRENLKKKSDVEAANLALRGLVAKSFGESRNNPGRVLMGASSAQKAAEARARANGADEATARKEGAKASMEYLIKADPKLAMLFKVLNETGIELNFDDKSLEDALKKVKTLQKEINSVAEDIENSVKRFVGNQKGALATTMALGVGMAAFANKIGQATRNMSDMVLQFRKFDLNRKIMTGSTLLGKLGSEGLQGVADKLKMTNAEAAGFFRVMADGVTSGIASIEQMTTAATKLTEAYGEDPTARLQNYINLLKEFPDLDTDLSVSMDMDSKAETWFALAQKGKINEVIELQNAGLAGGSDKSLEQTKDDNELERESLEYQRQYAKTAENINKEVSKYFPAQLVGLGGLTASIAATVANLIGIHTALKGGVQALDNILTQRKNIQAENKPLSMRRNELISGQTRQDASLSKQEQSEVKKSTGRVEKATSDSSRNIVLAINRAAGHICKCVSLRTGGRSRGDYKKGPKNLGGQGSKKAMNSVASGAGRKAAGQAASQVANQAVGQTATKMAGQVAAKAVGPTIARTVAGSLMPTVASFVGSATGMSGALAALTPALGALMNPVTGLAVAAVAAAAGMVALATYSKEALLYGDKQIKEGEKTTGIMGAMQEAWGYIVNGATHAAKWLTKLGKIVLSVKHPFAALALALRDHSIRIKKEEARARQIDANRMDSKEINEEKEKKSALEYQAVVNAIKAYANNNKTMLAKFKQEGATMKINNGAQLGIDSTGFANGVVEAQKAIDRQYEIVSQGLMKTAQAALNNKALDEQKKGLALTQAFQEELKARQKYIQDLHKSLTTLSGLLENQISKLTGTINDSFMGMAQTIEGTYVSISTMATMNGEKTNAAFKAMKATTEQLKKNAATANGAIEKGKKDQKEFIKQNKGSFIEAGIDTNKFDDKEYVKRETDKLISKQEKLREKLGGLGEAAFDAAKAMDEVEHFATRKKRMDAKMGEDNYFNKVESMAGTQEVKEIYEEHLKEYGGDEETAKKKTMEDVAAKTKNVFKDDKDKALSAVKEFLGIDSKTEKINEAVTEALRGYSSIEDHGSEELKKIYKDLKAINAKEDPGKAYQLLKEMQAAIILEKETFKQAEEKATKELEKRLDKVKEEIAKDTNRTKEQVSTNEAKNYIKNNKEKHKEQYEALNKAENAQKLLEQATKDWNAALAQTHGEIAKQIFTNMGEYLKNIQDVINQVNNGPQIKHLQQTSKIMNQNMANAFLLGANIGDTMAKADAAQLAVEEGRLKSAEALFENISAQQESVAGYVERSKKGENNVAEDMSEEIKKNNVKQIFDVKGTAGEKAFDESLKEFANAVLQGDQSGQSTQLKKIEAALVESGASEVQITNILSQIKSQWQSLDVLNESMFQAIDNLVNESNNALQKSLEVFTNRLTRTLENLPKTIGESIAEAMGRTGSNLIEAGAMGAGGQVGAKGVEQAIVSEIKRFEELEKKAKEAFETAKANQQREKEKLDKLGEGKKEEAERNVDEYAKAMRENQNIMARKETLRVEQDEINRKGANDDSSKKRLKEISGELSNLEKEAKKYSAVITKASEATKILYGVQVQDADVELRKSEIIKVAANKAKVTFDMARNSVKKFMDNLETAAMIVRDVEKEFAQIEVEKAILSYDGKAGQEAGGKMISAINANYKEMTDSLHEFAKEIKKNNPDWDKVSESDLKEHSALMKKKAALGENFKEDARLKELNEKLGPYIAIRKLEAEETKLQVQETKDLMDATNKKYEAEFKMLELQMGLIDAQKDYLESMGASYDVVVGAQMESIRLEAQKLQTMRNAHADTLKLIEERKAAGKDYSALLGQAQQQAIDIEKQKYALNKKAAAAQRDTYEKLIAYQFGTIRRSRGARRGIGTAQQIRGGGIIRNAQGTEIGGAEKGKTLAQMQVMMGEAIMIGKTSENLMDQQAASQMNRMDEVTRFFGGALEKASDFVNKFASTFMDANDTFRRIFGGAKGGDKPKDEKEKEKEAEKAQEEKATAEEKVKKAREELETETKILAQKEKELKEATEKRDALKYSHQEYSREDTAVKAKQEEVDAQREKVTQKAVASNKADAAAKEASEKAAKAANETHNPESGKKFELSANFGDFIKEGAKGIWGGLKTGYASIKDKIVGQKEAELGEMDKRIAGMGEGTEKNDAIEERNKKAQEIERLRNDDFAPMAQVANRTGSIDDNVSEILAVLKGMANNGAPGGIDVAAAGGIDKVVSKPTRLLVGENGPERLTVTPFKSGGQTFIRDKAKGNLSDPDAILDNGTPEGQPIVGTPENKVAVEIAANGNPEAAKKEEAQPINPNTGKPFAKYQKYDFSKKITGFDPAEPAFVIKRSGQKVSADASLWTWAWSNKQELKDRDYVVRNLPKLDDLYYGIQADRDLILDEKSKLSNRQKLKVAEAMQKKYNLYLSLKDLIMKKTSAFGAWEASKMSWDEWKSWYAKHALNKVKGELTLGFMEEDETKWKEMQKASDGVSVKQFIHEYPDIFGNGEEQFYLAPNRNQLASSMAALREQQESNLKDIKNLSTALKTTQIAEEVGIVAGEMALGAPSLIGLGAKGLMAGGKFGGKLAVGLGKAIMNTKFARTIVYGIKHSLRHGKLGKGIEAIKGVKNVIAKKAGEWFGKGAQGASGVLDAIKGRLGGAKEFIKNSWVGKLGAGAKDGLMKAGSFVKDKVGKIGGFAKDKIKGAIGYLGETRLGKAAKVVGSYLKEDAIKTVAHLKGTMSDIGKWLVEHKGETAFEKFNAWYGKRFGSKMAGKAANKAGQQGAEAIKEGAEALEKKETKTAAKEVSGEILESAEEKEARIAAENAKQVAKKAEQDLAKAQEAEAKELAESAAKRKEMVEAAEMNYMNNMEQIREQLHPLLRNNPNPITQKRILENYQSIKKQLSDELKRVKEMARKPPVSTETSVIRQGHEAILQTAREAEREASAKYAQIVAKSRINGLNKGPAGVLKSLRQGLSEALGKGSKAKQLVGRILPKGIKGAQLLEMFGKGASVALKFANLFDRQKSLDVPNPEDFGKADKNGQVSANEKKKIKSVVEVAKAVVVNKAREQQSKTEEAKQKETAQTTQTTQTAQTAQTAQEGPTSSCKNPRYLELLKKSKELGSKFSTTTNPEYYEMKYFNKLCSVEMYKNSIAKKKARDERFRNKGWDVDDRNLDWGTNDDYQVGLEKAEVAADEYYAKWQQLLGGKKLEFGGNQYDEEYEAQQQALRNAVDSGEISKEEYRERRNRLDVRKLDQKRSASKFGGGTGLGAYQTHGPETILVGDNPGGVENVYVEPVGSKGQTKISSSSKMTPAPASAMAQFGAGTLASPFSSGRDLFMDYQGARSNPTAKVEAEVSIDLSGTIKVGIEFEDNGELKTYIKNAMLEAISSDKSTRNAIISTIKAEI